MENKAIQEAKEREQERRKHMEELELKSQMGRAMLAQEQQEREDDRLEQEQLRQAREAQIKAQ